MYLVPHADGDPGKQGPDSATNDEIHNQTGNYTNGPDDSMCGCDRGTTDDE